MRRGYAAHPAPGHGFPRQCSHRIVAYCEPEAGSRGTNPDNGRFRPRSGDSGTDSGVVPNRVRRGQHLNCSIALNAKETRVECVPRWGTAICAPLLSARRFGTRNTRRAPRKVPDAARSQFGPPLRKDDAAPLVALMIGAAAATGTYALIDNGDAAIQVPKGNRRRDAGSAFRRHPRQERGRHRCCDQPDAQRRGP